MKNLHTLLLATAIVAGGTVAASAQATNSPSGAGMNSNVSAATHCKNAQGQVQLKSAANTQGGSPARTGSGTTGAAAGAGTSTGSSSMSGSASGAGASAGGSAAANLPAC